ncbi:BnaA01g17270D [Brassica napus]|uniref:BnaA01g17270D protein n=1 Tax=Brassica napus TaxID=3708 RepID=A0A078H419_BRANA|nr:BnaA01g17270D [Brassica napus]
MKSKANLVFVKIVEEKEQMVSTKKSLESFKAL